MSDERLQQLIDAWRDDEMTVAQAAELNGLLRESAEARRTFAAGSKLHGLLHCAVTAAAVERIASVTDTSRSDNRETAYSRDRSARRGQAVSRSLLLVTSVAVCLLLALLAGRQWAPTELTPQPDPGLKLAEVRYAQDAVLTQQDSHAPNQETLFEAGSRLGPGMYTLASGFVELDFFGGTVMAVESPATLELVSQQEARLLAGRVTIDAGDAVTTFLLQTPVGDLLDIGTRYGVFVARDGSTETHVFEGEVDIRQTASPRSGRRVEADSAIRITPAGLASSLPVSVNEFPEPTRRISDLLRDGDFEVETRLLRGDAETFGVWGGDICRIVGKQETIRPFSGHGMLLFQSTGQRDDSDRSAETAASQLSQWIDLQPYRQAITAGRVRALLSARFNRVAGNDLTDSQFSIHLEAFEVAPREARQRVKARPRAPRSRISYDLLSDSDPESWEKAEAVLTLPPTARCLHATVFAFENVSNDRGTTPEFDGHFADNLQFELLIEPTGSEVSGNK